MSRTQEDEEILIYTILGCASIIAAERVRIKRRKRKVWVKKWLLERRQKGEYDLLLNQLRLEDLESFRRYLRMNTTVFEELMHLVGPKITKQQTNMRQPISPEEKLAVTLRFLATGEIYESLQFHFRIHRSTISQFVPTVCDEIYKCLKDVYLTLPTTKEGWEEIIRKTVERWQFPNCFGAADGKHISMLKPVGTGSDYFNYKTFFSIVLLAIIDYDYRFLFVDVGCQGQISDGGVFRNSAIYSALMKGELNLPDPKPLPQSEDPLWAHHQNKDPVPHVFVVDDAFPLSNHCMKPYPQKDLSDRKRIFNYRLSRMRRISENTFGIWVTRFRVFTTTMRLSPEKATSVTMATVALHNLLRSKSKDSYTPPGFINEERDSGEIQSGAWREESDIDFTRTLPRGKVNHPPKSAKQYREMFADHFYGPGQLPWQWKVIV